jgi:hypothetical protein
MRKFRLLIFAVLANVSLHAQVGSFVVAAPPPFIGLGDSLGEGVQSADAASQTQVNGYLNLIAQQMGVSFPLPLIRTGLFGIVGNTFERNRINPSLAASNLAVSGADSTSILNEQAGTPIVSETDLVLAPRTGSQISIAESLRSPFTICWIGSNDVLGAILDFDQLNPTQIAAAITPPSVFQSNYAQITSRLGALGGKLVFANIPDVTQIAFLFSPQDLIAFLGSDYGLPNGSYTSVVAMLLIKLGLNDGSVLQNPDWVLDPSEIQTLEQSVAGFNQIIAADAAQVGAPVVDTNALFNNYLQNPVVMGGITLTRQYLGGLFSLDGVHPSDIGYALVANAFIEKIDSFYGKTIPTLNSTQLNAIFEADPFIDFNHNLRVQGRFGVGLVETLAPFLGISGEAPPAPVSPGVNKALGELFMQAYFASQGKDPHTKWTEQDAIAAFHQLFKLAK